MTELYKTTNDPAFIKMVENTPADTDIALKSSHIADAFGS